ncbi:MarR family transcriptional regulator [Vagococcus sp. PNs007]|uniref:MarR family transcriptional regulator n=1 Tax=Vagococcus proximus TaxID=2991417 RepID=A0ABT5X1Y4_9ENTE|nr:MarR family transcriptional regulator [Vagococcus proximus]MDF0480016.1 MarR family transcriptional regulator [Vagococcus proximus]
MDKRIAQVNDYLVAVFNDILSIEESELQSGQFSDISVKEMHTIEAIGLHDTKTSSEVAEKLSITVGTLTVAINNLVKKDYVERVRTDEDRRVVRLKLTNKGRLFYRAHAQFHKNMVEAALSDMSEEEQDAISKGLKNLHAFLQRHY